MSGRVAVGRVVDREVVGPCQRHLQDAVARSAPLVRAAVVGLSGVFGLAGHPGSAWPVAVSLLAVATVVPCAQSRWGSAAPGGFLVLGGVLSVAVGLSQGPLGARPVSGWLFATVSIMAVTCYFEWPDRLWAGHVLAGLTVLGYCGGCLLAGRAVPGWGVRHLLVQAALSWVGLLLVVRAARLCDQLVRRAEQRRVAAAAVRAQRSADRDYLAMLHDTASTTLLMVSTDRTGVFDWLPAAARRDLEVLTSYTPVPDDPVDLAGLLLSLTAYPGLAVRAVVGSLSPVPPRVAFAIYHGVREALTNVQRHAGDPSPVLTGHDRGGQVVVRLSDLGRGFDPGAVPAYRRGLAESVHARMAAVGGVADVRSAPGRGTTVEWTWSRG